MADLPTRALVLFEGWPRPVQSACLVLLTGLVLFLALLLSSGGDAPFMYATF